MKKLFVLIVLATIFLVLMGNMLQAQTAVTQWGSTPRGTSDWTILNTASTPAGNASMGGTAAPTAWMSIKGGFAPMTPTTSQAFVISGTFEFVGGGNGSAYTWLRFALFNEAGTLTGQNTPTAAWSEDANAYGYEFDPRSGAGTIANGSGGGVGEQGTEWYIVNSKSWTSTNSNGGRAISTILQAPYNQVATAGVYDFAISVQPLSSGGSEVRWYFVQQHAAGSINYYWWGGSFVDPTPVATAFNSIGFGVNGSGVDASMKQVNLANVKVALGVPITVPEAPFQSFYVNAWGSTPRGTSDWTILNDSIYVDGNASMGGTAAPTAWMSIKGGFRETVKPTVAKAMVITGTLEFVGGGNGSAYTWLRYALFNQRGTLSNQYKPTAAWSEDTVAWGYEFDPRSGAGTVSNGSGGGVGEQGTEWYVVNSKSWTSTNSNGGRAISTILQAPYNQVATAGVYDFAISVQPLSSGGSEVRWYFIQQHAAGTMNYYWWGGSFVDPTPVSTAFNSIGFAVNGSGVDATMKRVNIKDVKVDLTTPITVPVAPFQSFYINAWGSTPRGTQDWTILNDSTYVDGNASMGGTAAPTNWMSIKGGFRETVKPTVDKALVVTGTFEFVGGGNGSAYTWLRYALFNQRGTLSNQNKSTAAWSEDTVAWGYEFDPRSGAGTVSNGSGGGVGEQGTEWYVVNSKSWTSTNSNGGRAISTILQAPANQVATAGVYDFAISVQPLSSGGSEVRWYFIQQHAANSNSYYWWGGSFVDPTPVSTAFNSIGFAVNGSGVDATMKRVNIKDVKVDLTTPITVPTAPWQAYYVNQWGFIGGRIYGWNFTPGDQDGNATISGTKPNDKWAAIRGGFEPVTPTTAKALVLTGKVELVGGGLYAPGTLRFGTFYSDVAGKVIIDSAKATLPDSTRWDGLETYTSGYLFTPPVGSTGLFNWTGVNQTASAGGVVNGAWLHTDYPGTGGLTNNYTLGTDVQTPANAAFAAGVYDFAISVAAKSATSNDVRWKLSKGTSYSITGKLTDSHAPLAAKKFNSVNFAISGDALTTGLKLTDVKVDYVDVASVPIASIVGVTSVEETGSGVPMEFALSQNYPNPFNPSTTIRYDVAKPAHVTIRVYDVLGRVVAQLVDAAQAPSSYLVHWNPSGLSSGTYLYRIDAQNVDGSGTFSSVKKLILMK